MESSSQTPITPLSPIEHGCEFATADAEFAWFAGLRHIHPLA